MAWPSGTRGANTPSAHDPGALAMNLRPGESNYAYQFQSSIVQQSSPVSPYVATPSPSWQWDSGRERYYIWSAAENCYIYADGERIEMNGEVRSAAGGDTTNSSYDVAQGLGSMNLSESMFPSSQNPLSSRNTRESWQGQAAKERILRGNSLGHAETMNPEYRVRRDWKEFFQPGRVFKAYWPEPRDGSPTTSSSLTDTSKDQYKQRPKEQLYAKIRWFVVIKATNDYFSLCLPIRTYGSRGVARNDILKHQHAIIHTGEISPRPLKDEKPRNIDESPMLWPIRVRAKRRADKMDPKARVNFAKMYSIERNVKVCEFGAVHPDHLSIFLGQFRWVLHRQIEEDIDEKDEEEGEEEDDNEDENDEKEE